MATERIMLEVEPRDRIGKGHNKRLRAAGRVPGNVYGLGLDPFSISVEPKRVEELLRSASGRNTILTLSMKGAAEGREVMIREIQRDPVGEDLTHLDFVRVDPDRVIQVRVPVHLIGTADGVKNEGGLLDFIHREVLVKCVPASIPEHLEIDVEPLHIGQHLEVKHLTVPEQVEVLDDPEMVLVVIAAPKAEEEPVPVEGEEEAEAVAEAAEAEGEAPAEAAPEDGDS